MSLIEVDAHTEADLEHWRRLRISDQAHARSRALDRKIKQSLDEIEAFLQRKDDVYVSVSWGKDSVVTADLCMRVSADIPVAHVKPWPLYNPHCDKVRNTFLENHDCAYHEIVVTMESHKKGWRIGGNTRIGYGIAHDLFGAHVSGLRKDESGIRKIRFNRWGLSSDNTCAPIGWWSIQDVFSYLQRRNLPIHPTYGMLRGGYLDRADVRVDAIGGERGQQYGRLDWEKQYYHDRMNWIRKTWEQQTGRTSSSNMPFYYNK